MFHNFLCSGTHQGSVLGSILFIINVNDILLEIKYLKICLHADDLKLYLPISYHNDINNLQSDINSLSSWCKLWSLKLDWKKIVV